VYVFLIFFGLYFLWIIVLGLGWQRSLHSPSSPRVQIEPITVIVAFRNEESNLPNLVHDLLRQTLPPTQIILVNDHSTDQSLAWALQAEKSHSTIKVISLSGEEGKKQAIMKGVSVTSTDWVCLTDADCRLPASWLMALQQKMTIQTQFIIGPVRLAEKRLLFSKLQETEWLSLQAVTFASAALHRPLMCNAANLAFRKTAFDQVKGYEGNEGIASGDDEFLMRKIQTWKTDGIQYINTTEAVVSTEGQASWIHFFNQRIRWASKWKYNTSRLAKFMALTLFLFQGCYAVLGVGWLMGFIPSSLAFPLLGGKWVLDAALLVTVAIHHRNRISYVSMVILQIFYPFYVIGVGFFSWRKTYHWKDRVVRS
jgi:poly-beta-1,6-N-acetyl-D-glucosamine synthase